MLDRNPLKSNSHSEKLIKELAKRQALEQKEIWHNLVVKVISWKDDTSIKDFLDKISPEEWKDYKKRLTTANSVYNATKIEIRLKETFQKIMKNGGFA